MGSAAHVSGSRTPNRVAIDVGTNETKLFAGSISDSVNVSEVYRFDSRRIDAGDDRVWDVSHLLDEIQTGLELVEREHGRIATVGIDATAEMIGLVADGAISSPPVHTASVHTERTLGGISAADMFAETGHARLPNRYYGLHRDDSAVIDDADWVGPFPSLIAHELGARPHGELTYAISAGLGNTRTRRWCTEILERLDLRTDLLPELQRIGSSVGTLAVDGISSAPELVVVPGHDTSAAVAGIPFRDEDRAFLATGSWFITGFELDRPIVSEAAYEASAENMGGVDGTARFVRNTPGFSLLEQCRAEWRAAGNIHEYDDLFRAVRDTPAFGPVIDPGHRLLLEAHFTGDAPARIREFCRRTEQAVPRGPGETTRCILESLATSAALLLDRLGRMADRQPSTLHLVGGGARNELLCRMVAAAADATVYAGPVEATAIGSVLCQSWAAGDVTSIAAGRRTVAEKVGIRRYDPDDPDAWENALDLLAELREGGVDAF